MRYFFERLDEKTICRKFLRKFSKILKNFLKKIEKMHYFRLVFSQFNQAWVNFSAFGRKTQLGENF